MSSSSSLKQLVIFGIALAVISHSICIVDARQKQIDRIDRLFQDDSENFRDRSYIKTYDGPREAKRTSLEVVTTTAPDGETRKLFSGEIRCILWQNCMLFQDDQGDTHQWECTFDDPKIIDQYGGYKSKLVIVNGVENVNHFLELNGADSGKSVLVMEEASIETDQLVVDATKVLGVEAYKPDDGSVGGGFRGHAKPPKTDRRRLAEKTGILNTLVVRVNALDNNPVADPAQISSDVFGDENNLKTQIAACSYNKLQIQEYIPGEISQVETQAPGVVDVFIDVNAQGNTRNKIQNEANAALQALFGTSDPSTIFDLVLFCMPPGTGNWLAYAYISRWDSYYNNDWCQMMSSQLHEVGHSIGLHHSGEYTGSDSNQEYGDQSDLMGFSYKSDDTPRMCFNPAKNWQLGWYSDKQVEIDPNNLSQEPTSFILNGVVDYGDATQDAKVVVKVGDFYIGYNKASSFNNQVKEGANQVLVNEKMGSATASAKSKLAAKLDVGAVYNIKLSELLTVQVKFAAFLNSKDAVIELSILGDIPQCQGAYDSEIVVDLTTDNYPSETSWSIVDAAGLAVYSKDDYALRGTYKSTISGLCRGLQYYFVIEDSYGDGICCSWGTGSFTGKFGDLTLFEGGEFESRLTIPFTLPLITAGDCVDDPTFIYRNREGDDCANFVAPHSDRRTRIICQRRANADESDKRKVFEYCRATCDAAGINRACNKQLVQ